MDGKFSLRASNLSDTRALLAIVQRKMLESSSSLSALSRELEQLRTNVLLTTCNAGRMPEMATDSIVQNLGQMTEQLSSFLDSVKSQQIPKLLFEVLRREDLFTGLYTFVSFLPRLADTHDLWEVNFRHTHLFLLTLARFQASFHHDSVLSNPAGRRLLLLTAGLFLQSYSITIPYYPVKPNDSIALQTPADTGHTEVNGFYMVCELFQYMLSISRVFEQTDSISMASHFFFFLDQLLVYCLPLWSAKSLTQTYLQCQTYPAGTEATFTTPPHMTEVFPYLTYSYILQFTLFAYSRRAIALAPENIISSMAIDCATIESFLATLQSLIDHISNSPSDASSESLTPIVFFDDAKLFTFFSKFCLMCTQLLDCFISQIFKPDGFPSYLFAGDGLREIPEKVVVLKEDSDLFTETFFQYNGWNSLMRILYYTGDGTLEEIIEPPVTELLSQITHCTDMKWIKEQGYLCSGFSTRLAHILVKSHSRNAKLAVFYTLCNIVIDQGYELVAIEPVISACIKNFRSTITTVVYEAHRLLVLLLQTGKVSNRDAYQTALLHMINQKLSARLVRSFTATSQATLTQKSLPRSLHKLASMQLKLFNELIECSKEHPELATPLYDAKHELSKAIEEIDIRATEELSISCKELIDFIQE